MSSISRESVKDILEQDSLARKDEKSLEQYLIGLGGQVHHLRRGTRDLVLSICTALGWEDSPLYRTVDDLAGIDALRESNWRLFSLVGDEIARLGGLKDHLTRPVGFGKEIERALDDATLLGIVREDSGADNLGRVMMEIRRCFPDREGHTGILSGAHDRGLISCQELTVHSLNPVDGSVNRQEAMQDSPKQDRKKTVFRKVNRQEAMQDPPKQDRKKTVFRKVNRQEAMQDPPKQDRKRIAFRKVETDEG